MWKLLFVSLTLVIVAGSSGQLPGSRSAAEIRKIQEALRKEPPPAFKDIVARRRAERTALQRLGYAGILFETLRRDELGALLAGFRMNLQMSLSLSHGFLFWIIPPDPEFNTPGIAFEEDYSFPSDPWEEL